MSNPPPRSLDYNARPFEAAPYIGKLLILLNGKPQERVTAYDVERGRLSRLVTDESGRLVNDGERWLEEDCIGSVEVRWK